MVLEKFSVVRQWVTFTWQILKFLSHVVGEKGEIMILIEEYVLWLKHILTHYLKKNHVVWLKGQCNSQLISGILLK